MKKFALSFLLILFYFVSYSQIIKGTVVDKNTNAKIYKASVYFNGTSTGTTTDEDGNFSLDISKNLSMSISISAIGYYSVSKSIYSTNELLEIQLMPKVYSLNEVVVSSKSLKKRREINLEIFREQFLGTTYNSTNCKILNESDITFNYESDKDTLKAFASKPLEIDNKALGYRVTYYLDKFEYVKVNGFIFSIGSALFAENLPDSKMLKKIQNDRQKTYLGSQVHFLRALWSNKLEAEGFVLKSWKGAIFKYGDIVVESGNNKYFSGSNRFLKVYYGTQMTNLVLRDQYVKFDPRGYFDPVGIGWFGAMTNQRIADRLPSDYIPMEKKSKEFK